MRDNTLPIATAQTTEFPEHDTAANRAFGFWIYIMSDLVVFATLFAAFAVLGRNYAGGPGGKEIFDLPYLFGETILLLLSSAAYSLTLSGIHGENRRLVLAGLGITFLFGLGFISMEMNEFSGMILNGNGPGRSAFLSAFFTLVGTHGMHVSFGLIWMAVMVGQVFSGGLTSPVESRLTRLGMFWHLLDIVWIGIFSIVYLMGVI